MPAGPGEAAAGMQQPEPAVAAAADDVDLQPAAAAAACSTAGDGLPRSWLIQYNVSKKHNIGTLARCATAFNVAEVCLVGSRQFNSFGAHGADSYVSFSHHSSLDECCASLRQNKGCTIVGVEIVEGARPVHNFPFRGNTAFMLGNEGQGLNERQVALCDEFIYIPQYGPGTASLNVAVAASIVLHHFALWAGYEERAREGQKFVLGDRPQRTAARGVVPLTAEEQAAERARRRQSAADGDGDAAALPALI
ncbi:family tRNA rRNA methyltransferase [Micractinium conductrix]|uniref:Family tRNA rRNA methyltransferase n=1 Tax=Micractinium conductrix TaxID=554055 RepID=A0A2P6VNB7_9CHLO|nr:family tRNA rRNA methyltransferase [Micractinium conductrix]|eukprot:PSC75588.1 family tRNA rRNA methyltransferase [Micractinium conductrix]